MLYKSIAEHDVGSSFSIAPNGVSFDLVCRANSSRFDQYHATLNRSLTCDRPPSSRAFSSSRPAWRRLEHGNGSLGMGRISARHSIRAALPGAVRQAIAVSTVNLPSNLLDCDVPDALDEQGR